MLFIVVTFIFPFVELWRMEEKETIDKITTFISQKIIRLRKQKGYSSHETFAYDYNFSRMQYWRLEKGKTTPTLTTLIRILAIHNLSIKEFFEDFE